MIRTKCYKECLNIHFETRGCERVGYPLSSKTITREIRDGVLPLYKEQSKNRKIYLKVIEDRTYRIVYDRKRKQPITVYEHRVPNTNTNINLSSRI